MKYVLCVMLMFLVTSKNSCYANEATNNNSPPPVEKNYTLINDLQSQLDTMMQDSAAWIDNIGADEATRNTASANGYLQLAWQPRSANLNNTEIKFKVNLNLPRWSDRLALILDNNNEDELKVDYESDLLTPQTENEEINIAFQYMKIVNDHVKIKNRIGVSRKQLYARTELKYHWQQGKLFFYLFPRIDYFNQDGWGPGLKASLHYAFPKDVLSLSSSSQKIEVEKRSRKKIALHYICNINQKQLAVSGIQYTRDNNEQDIALDSYSVSIRYRRLVYKKWLFFEAEPFIEFNEIKDYRREGGILLSLITHYGNN